MKTTIQLTIHAPSKKAAVECLTYLRLCWNALRGSGEAPVDTFLEYGYPKGAKRGKAKK